MSYFRLKNSMKLYYKDVGQGPAVIMLHGWTSNHKIFDKPAKYLQSSARCIYYDQRGHGNSRDANITMPSMEELAEDLRELIVGLSLSDITLVGWSMGAGVVMNYIKEYGCADLRQIVICDMTPKQLNDDIWNMGLYKGEYKQTDRTASSEKDFLSVYKAFAIGAKPVLKNMPQFLLDHILKKRLMYCDENVLKSLSKSMLSQDNREVIKDISVPFTYFYPIPGSLFSPELSDWYKDNIKTKFRAVPFNNCTHLFISENPERFAKAIEMLVR